MRWRVRTTLLAALIGAISGWGLSDLYSARTTLSGVPLESDEVSEDNRSASSSTPDIDIIDAAEVIAVEDMTGLTRVIVAPPPSDEITAEPISLPPVNTPVSEVRAGIDPMTSVAEPADVADGILGEFLNPKDLRCEFGAGNGGNWPTGGLNVHDEEWQGGPIQFQSVNLDAGTAVMIGTVGATDSLDGSIDTRAIATSVGLHFLALTSNGYLITTTVFNDRDTNGRFVAVMSRHEGSRGQIYTEGAQFYGFCN